MPGDDLPNTTRRYLRRLADAIVKTSKKPVTNAPTRQTVWGVVDSIQAGPPRSLTLYLSGNTAAPIAGIRYLASYTPTVGDTVVCERNGTDLVALGGMRGAVASGGNLPLDWAWSGATALAAGATAYIPPRRLAIASPVTILGVQYFGRTGGDVFELYYNGAALGSPQQWTTVSETWETDTSSVFPFDASDGDTFRPVVETAAGDGWCFGVIYVAS